jgi:hypothetical protein
VIYNYRDVYRDDYRYINAGLHQEVPLAAMGDKKTFSSGGQKVLKTELARISFGCIL